MELNDQIPVWFALIDLIPIIFGLGKFLFDIFFTEDTTQSLNSFVIFIQGKLPSAEMIIVSLQLSHFIFQLLIVMWCDVMWCRPVWWHQLTELFCYSCYSNPRIVTVCIVPCRMLSCHTTWDWDSPMTVAECRKELTRSYLTRHSAVERRGVPALPYSPRLVWRTPHLTSPHLTSCTETG